MVTGTGNVFPSQLENKKYLPLEEVVGFEKVTDAIASSDSAVYAPKLIRNELKKSEFKLMNNSNNNSLVIEDACINHTKYHFNLEVTMKNYTGYIAKPRELFDGSYASGSITFKTPQ